ncbi:MULTISPECIES: sce7725 family protein [Snodgrassella]|uniref:sce7725 family protein n=1 Tax=Snodgrassella TaxID=1193515 RepID=UPI000A046387|nr:MULTISPECIES: sce7725 family protein [Snodgrassella]MBI0133284.1 sce7725 family protein [Snodgrassella sp. W8132]ORF32110.1 hypothetical protein BGI09_04180 [Snodgrassella alvi]
MYYCFLRSKRFELLSIRKSADKINESNISIILEPVKNSFNEIQKTLSKINPNNFIFIINPKVGDLKNNDEQLIQLTKNLIESNSSLIVGLNVDHSYNFLQIQNWLNMFNQSKFVLIHSGEIRFDTKLINQQEQIIKHIFYKDSVEDYYINQFSKDKILLEDNFKRLKRNYDYQENRIEFFSDAHLNYKSNGYQGFGNFSTIGNHFSQNGGQAYTSAFHLTFNHTDRNDILIEHCLSKPRTYHENIGVLNEELLEDIHSVIQNNIGLLTWSSACQELEDMYQKKNFSYHLGTLKSLSIQHHFELMHLLKIKGVY